MHQSELNVRIERNARHLQARIRVIDMRFARLGLIAVHASKCSLMLSGCHHIITRTSSHLFLLPEFRRFTEDDGHSSMAQLNACFIVGGRSFLYSERAFRRWFRSILRITGIGDESPAEQVTTQKAQFSTNNTITHRSSSIFADVLTSVALALQ